MIVIRDYNGVVIRKSQNLRGIITHLGKQLAKTVAIDKQSNGEGLLSILWENGDSCQCKFASFTVLKDWVRNRRNLRGVKLLVNGVEE